MAKPPRLQAFLIFSYVFSSSILALSDADIARRQLLTFTQNADTGIGNEVEINQTFANQRLKKAYIGLQAWKKAIYSDPFSMTCNWVGPDVCAYHGVFCAPALDDSKLTVVAGVDLNHADIAGYLPPELGLIADLALLHLNSNRFCGIVPKSLDKLTLMHEFDVSNNCLVGSFPGVVLSWASLKYLDIRFNDFEGKLPPGIFEKELDALFLNNNRFTDRIPESIGKSTVSVVTFANNKFKGCIPHNIGKMVNLNEIVFMNNNLSGCFPTEFGLLGNVTVFDASFNSFTGTLPQSFSGLKKVELLDISHNKLTGVVPKIVCKLSSLSNFTFSYNYFKGVANDYISTSRNDIVLDDTHNCLAGRPKQRPVKECFQVVSRPVDCSKDRCGGGGSPDKSSPSKPPPPTPNAKAPKADETSPSPKSPEPVPDDDPHDHSPVNPTRPPAPVPTPEPTSIPSSEEDPHSEAPVVQLQSPTPTPSPVHSPSPTPSPLPVASAPQPTYLDLPSNLGNQYASPPLPISPGYS